MSFVHLHNHSHYSLLDGVTKIPALISAAKALHMPAVALTDHGNLYGAIEFYCEALEQDIKPIIGCEFYVTADINKKNAKERPAHLVILARNNTGYRHLVKLVTLAHLEGFYGKPRVDKQLLWKYREGLIGLSGCNRGEIPRLIAQKKLLSAQQCLDEYLKIFGRENFFLEVQHHPNLSEQKIVNEELANFSENLKVGLIATNDTHYLDPSDAEAQDILLCIQTKSLLADTTRLTMNNEDYSFHPPEKIIENLSQFPGAIENSLKIAEMANVTLELGKIQFPYFAVPVGITADEALGKLCADGLQKKFLDKKRVIEERLNYELEIIHKTGFASYFLIVQDFINWAKKQGITVGPGRGSAAGSLVAYLTNITDIDPIKYKLLFERFLNPERVSQPDIDSDFADTRRDDVLHYIEKKYGQDHVAQIITFGTMAARAAVRDVGRVMGLAYNFCDRLAKMIPMFMSLGQALNVVEELRQLVNDDPDAERLLSNAKKLEGVARHTSTHACAIVVTKEKLDEYVPLQHVDQQSKTLITQYAMGSIDKLGLLKIDLLGLKNLTIIENTLQLVKETLGKKITLADIPLNDPKTFSLLQKADTVGVFQLESTGMRRYLKQLQPTDLEDIIAMVSLFRPGPMEFIPLYIAGKHKKRKITYIDQRLEPILKSTYGIAVYQEQVLEIARQLAGFSYGEADVLRKAVGKKIKTLLDEQEKKFVEGMIKNGFKAKIAQKVWDFILPFARYGFNRSHAACYAMIAYRTAYLKANFPLHFMAALLNSDRADIDRIALEITHVRQMGIEVLPPHINESDQLFTVVQKSDSAVAIRFGLSAIKNLGAHIVSVIVEKRKERGLYVTLEDFLERVQDKDLNKKSLESLIKTGAMDCFGERNKLLFNLDLLLIFSRKHQIEKASGQGNLLANLNTKKSLKLIAAPPVANSQKLVWEKELLGLYVSGFPLAEYEQELRQLAPALSKLKEQTISEPVRQIGIITGTKKILTKNRETMLFVSLQDYSAAVELIIFPRVYKDTAHLWQENNVLEIKGKCDDSDGLRKIIVESATEFHLDRLTKVRVQKVYLIFPEQMTVMRFHDFENIVNQHLGDIPVLLNIQNKIFDTKRKVSMKAVVELKQVFGQKNVRVV